MKRTIATSLLLFLLAGCTTKQATRSRIELDISKIEQTGKLNIESPKDFRLENLTLTKSGTNYTVKVGSMSAVVSEAAVRSAVAEITSREATLKTLIDAFEKMAQRAADSQGVPRSTPSPSFQVPEGYKLVPRDDPSVPRWIPNPMPYTLPTNSFVVPFEFWGEATNRLNTMVISNIVTTNATIVDRQVIEKWLGDWREQHGLNRDGTTNQP